MRTDGTYKDIRTITLTILGAVIGSSAWKTPDTVLDRIDAFYAFADDQYQRKLLHRDYYENRQWTEHNLRGGYKFCFIGFVSEMVTLIYDYTKHGCVEDQYDSRFYNYELGVDFFTLHENEWKSNQVKTGRFTGTVLKFGKGWESGFAEYLYVYDIDDEILLIAKMSDYKMLLAQGISEINKNDTKCFQMINLENMFR